ncbi:antitoxin [Streptomyces sp. HNM0574]|uniref:antitoxin n=1 Tax=Streptomyces sp. HNM0574 TaxID=2714954 RepID=UPI001469FD55|nr:antitoxin [Streptomyces sp. HNM0574]NLU65701.1 antitoxin [Streptomyces sp. HNM0574]
MSFMDKVKGMLGQHGDKVTKGIDKAAQVADSKTKGKYSNQIRSGTQKAKDATERLGREGGQGGSGNGGGKGPGGA